MSAPASGTNEVFALIDPSLATKLFEQSAQKVSTWLGLSAINSKGKEDADSESN